LPAGPGAYFVRLDERGHEQQEGGSAGAQYGKASALVQLGPVA
jgi:hypothetical protein